jgi:single-strand DNA-binding protein
MNLNKVFLLGRVTADPQLRSTPNGMQVATFSIATNRVWNDQSGAKKESTEFHNVVVWGRQAEVASRFLKKGSLVLVEGRLQTREWEGKDGQKRRTTEIICERMQLGPRPMGGGAASGPADETREALPTVEVGDSEIKSEDLPF